MESATSLRRCVAAIRLAAVEALEPRALLSASAVEGIASTLTLGTFVSDRIGTPASAFSATIAWGDGLSERGTVRAQGDGHFSVTGRHAYFDEGRYVVTVIIKGPVAGTGTLNTPVLVKDAPVSAQGRDVTADRFQAFTGTVASFTDANPYAVASEFSATVYWGDGGSGAGGVIRRDDGRFGVLAAHAYDREGLFRTTVLITDEGGSTAIAHGTVRVPAPPAEIAGTLYRDDNASGGNDDEPRLKGWTVYLDTNANGRHDAGETTSTTDGAGGYRFLGLPPGTYRVRAVVKPGFRAVNPGPGGARPVTVGAGERAAAAADFGFTPLALVTGNVFEDPNRNGRRDGGEGPLYGQVFADGNGNGALDRDEPYAFSDGAGDYRIDLPAGGYVLRLASQAGTTVTAPAGGSYPLKLSSGQRASGKDFGVFDGVNVPAGLRAGPIPAAAGDGLNGAIFSGTAGDLPGHGDASVWYPEVSSVAAGASDATFAARALDYWGSAYDTLASWLGPDAASLSPASAGGEGVGALNLRVWGYIAIPAPGPYRLGTHSDDWSALRIGDVRFGGVDYIHHDDGPMTSNVYFGKPGLYPIEGLYGENGINEASFGVLLNDAPIPASLLYRTRGGAAPATVRGAVFDDAKRDGKDSADPGLANWRVYLDADNDGERDANELSAATDGNGKYVLAGLDAGTYLVRVEGRAGFAATPPTGGRSVKVSAGKTAGHVDFGVAATAGGKLLFADHFAGTASSQWKSARGEQIVSRGWYYAGGGGDGGGAAAFVHDGDATWSDYTLRATVDPLMIYIPGSDSQYLRRADLYFHARGLASGNAAATGYRLELAGPAYSEDAAITLYRLDHGRTTVLAQRSGVVGRSVMDVQVKLTAGNIMVSIGGTTVFDVTDGHPFLKGGIGVGAPLQAGARFDDVVVTSPTGGL